MYGNCSVERKIIFLSMSFIILVWLSLVVGGGRRGQWEFICTWRRTDNKTPNIQRSGEYAIQRRIFLLISAFTKFVSLSAYLFSNHLCLVHLAIYVVAIFWHWSVMCNFVSSLARLPQGATFVVLWTIGTLLRSPQLSSMTLLNILRGSLEIAFRNFSEMAKVSFCTSRVFCHFIVTNSLYHQSFRANPPIRKLAECRSPEKSKSSGSTFSHQKSVLRWGIYHKQQPQNI